MDDPGELPSGSKDHERQEGRSDLQGHGQVFPIRTHHTTLLKDMWAKTLEKVRPHHVDKFQQVVCPDCLLPHRTVFSSCL